MKKFLLFLGVLSLAMFTACGPADQTGERTTDDQKERRSAGQAAIADDGSDPTVVRIAAGSEDHTTLVAALDHANYIDPLANPGPFTVFAPTNDAFDQLPDGVLDDLLKDENLNQLLDILEYHLLIGVYETDAMFDGQLIGTANGPPVTIEIDDGGNVQVDGNNIMASIRAANGVVHVIDGVLIPE